MSRSALLLAFMNFLAAGTGFFREASIAYRFGASSAADAISVTLLLIESVALVFVFGLSMYMMVPVITDLLSQGPEANGEQSSFAFTESVSLWILILGAIAVLPALWAPRSVALILGPKFSPEQLSDLSLLLRLSAMAIPLVAFSGVLAGLLQAMSSYCWTPFGRAFYSCTIAASVLAAPRGRELIWGGLGMTLGAAIQALVHVMAIYRRGWRPVRLPSIWHTHLGDAWKLGVPGLAVLLLINVFQGNLQRILASGLPPGSLASINYAQRAVSLLATFSTAVCTVAVTAMSNSFAVSGLGPGSTKMLIQQVVKPLAWLTPLSIILCVSSESIIKLLFQHGNFAPESLALCAQCLRWLSVGALPGLIIGILLRAYGCFLRPWRGVVIATIWTVASVVSTWLLLDKMGAVAVPAGYLIGTITACLASIADLGLLAGNVRWLVWLRGTGRVFVPALIAGLVASNFTSIVPAVAPWWLGQIITVGERSIIVVGISIAGGLLLREPAFLELWARMRISAPRINP